MTVFSGFSCYCSFREILNLTSDDVLYESWLSGLNLKMSPLALPPHIVIFFVILLNMFFFSPLSENVEMSNVCSVFYASEWAFSTIGVATSPDTGVSTVCCAWDAFKFSTPLLRPAEHTSPDSCYAISSPTSSYVIPPPNSWYVSPATSRRNVLLRCRARRLHKVARRGG